MVQDRVVVAAAVVAAFVVPPLVASEFVGTSITSQPWSQERLNQYLPDNPHMLLADSRYRGYVRTEVTRRRMTADLRAMAHVASADAPCSTNL